VTQRRSLWPYVPAALLALMVGGLLTLARIASDDPSFSVEPGYYAKAVAWDAHREQLRENERLGWKLEARTVRAPSGMVELRVRLRDRGGRTIRSATLDVEAFHNARAASVLSQRLVESAEEYRAELPMRRTGLWELRFTALSGPEKFTEVVRLELP
jgi:hypothetical protein